MKPPVCFFYVYFVHEDPFVWVVVSDVVNEVEHPEEGVSEDYFWDFFVYHSLVN